MRLLEAIIDANHRALSGDASAGVRPVDHADSLPLAALTCIDPRLNPLFPEVLGLPKENFVWLRNAGNIITGPLSSTLRSLALGCAIKGAREIAIIGHNDCQVGKTSTMKLTEAFHALGVERAKLPENLTEFFGMFASERQNVIRGVEFVRHSPLIGPKIPVHGLLVDVETGKLEWVVNGYQTLEQLATVTPDLGKLGEESVDALKSLVAFKIGEMKFPDTKIGELATEARDWLAHQIQPGFDKPAIETSPTVKVVARPVPPTSPTPVPVAPPKIPMPPPIRPEFKIPKRK